MITGEGDGGEFDSPGGGEEMRGRQSAATGDTSTAKTRSRSTIPKQISTAEGSREKEKVAGTAQGEK